MTTQITKITTVQFINRLVELLVIAEGGIVTLDDPLPVEVEQNIVNAVASFGKAALPFLHRLIESDISNNGERIFNNYGYIIDCIGKIKSPDSVELLMKFHKCCTGDMTAAAVLQALKAIGNKDAYHYLSDVLIQYISGNSQIIESSLDLHII